MNLTVSSSFYDIVSDFTTDYLILKGGSSSGKSVAVTQHIILHCLQGKHRVLVFRNSGVSLKDSVITCFIDILQQADIPYTYKSSYKELIIGESTVLFKPLQEEERIKSVAGVDMVWVEEANEINGDLFDQCVLRLRTPGVHLQYIVSFNPVVTANWTYKYFFDTTSDKYFFKDPSITFKIHESTYLDNPFINPQAIRNLEAMRLSNPRKFSIYGLGNWGSLSKLVFDYCDYEVKHLDLPAIGPKYIDGADPGWTDPFAISSSRYWYDNGELYIYTYQEWSASECTADIVVEQVKRLTQGRPCYTDNAAASQIGELHRLGAYNVVANHKPPGSVINHISMLHSAHWVIDPCCKELLRELTFYSWKKDRTSGEYIEEVERGSGATHANVIDSVFYSLEGIGAQANIVKIKSYKGL